MNIIFVNVTCFRTAIITVIIFAWFPAFSVYITRRFVCDVAYRFGFCGCPFFGGESREHYCDSSYKAQVAYIITTTVSSLTYLTKPATLASAVTCVECEMT